MTDASKSIPSAKLSAVGKDMEARAASFAAIVGADDTFNKDVSDYNEAKTTVQVGPLWVMLDLLAIEGLDLMQFPYPDTVEGKTNHPAGPAKYSLPVKGDAGTKPVTFDWYKSFCATLPEGKRIKHIMTQIGLAKALSGEKAEPEYVNMPVHERDQVLKDATSEFSALVNVVKKAVRLNYQYEAANELPGVVVEWRKDKEGSVKRTQHPVAIRDKADRDDFTNATITSFLGFNIEEAAENGGTKAALLATAGRDTDEDEDNDIGIIANAEQYESYTAEAAAAVEDDKFVASVYAGLSAKDSDDFLLSFYKHGEFMEKVMAKPNLRARYKALSEAKLDKSKAA